MKIDVSLSDEDREKLQRALGHEDKNDRVASVIAKAGAREALAQATGSAVFSGIADLRSFRIFCFLLEGMTLTEAEDLVARIFKVPAASAKRMVAAAVARYAVELETSLVTALREMLQAASWNAERDRWEIRMPTSFLRDRVFDVMSRTDLPNPEIASRGSLWRLPNETYAHLCADVGLSPPEPA